MLFPRVLWCAALLAAGCASAPKQEDESAASRRSKPKAPEVVAPANELAGKVVLVNEPLRYVVIDFGYGRVPQADQRLNVFRQGAKVAEVRISSQSRSANFAADIITGTVQTGDEVRP